MLTFWFVVVTTVSGPQLYPHANKNGVVGYHAYAEVDCKVVEINYRYSDPDLKISCLKVKGLTDLSTPPKSVPVVPQPKPFTKADLPIVPASAAETPSTKE